VNASNASGTSPWSGSWKFTTPVFQLGKIVMMSGLGARKGAQIYIINADGMNLIRLTDNMAGDWFPELSPDGSKIVFYSDRDGNNEIYIMNADGSNQNRLTNNPAMDTYPKWLPDGKRISFLSDRDGVSGVMHIYVMNADGINQSRLTKNTFFEGVHTWSPDAPKSPSTLTAMAMQKFML
jgi:Tol biopolymer transport system component